MSKVRVGKIYIIAGKINRKISRIKGRKDIITWIINKFSIILSRNPL